MLHLLRILPLWFWKHGFHQLLLHCLRNIWENILKNINFSSLFLFYARITYFQSPWQMIARIMDRQHKVFIFNVFNEMNLTDCSEYLFNLTDKYTSSRQQHSLKLNLFMYICGHVTSLILFTCIKSILVTTAKWRKNMVWIGLYLLSLKIGSQLMKWFQKLFLFFFLYVGYCSKMFDFPPTNLAQVQMITFKSR